MGLTKNVMNYSFKIIREKNLVFYPNTCIIIDEIQPQKDVSPIVTLERNKRKTAAPSAIQFTTKLKSQGSDFCSE